MIRDDRPSTIKEVAKLAGASASSVSRALNGHPDVSEKMKNRVLEAVERLGYRPDFFAQGLRSGATHTIGFIVRDISVPLFADMAKGAERELEARGYSVLLMNSWREPALEVKHIEVLSHRRVDGLILSLASEGSVESVHALRGIKVPIVLLDREISGVEADSVLFDHATGMHDAIAALLKLGHRRIGLIVGSSAIRPSRERLRGFMNAYEEVGLPFEEEYVFQMDAFAPELAVAAANSVLDKSPPPTAIVAGDSQLGIGLLKALRERGLREGDDISIVICDDIELLRYMDPPISAVSRDGEEMGAVAARLLLDRLEDSSGPPQIELLPTRFIYRGSTRPSSNGRDESGAPS
jgi:LacI family transcriptional regulator